LPYEKFLRLQQYYLDEPFGSQHETYRDGVIASILYNSNISKKENAKAPYDFFDSLPKPKQRSAQDPMFILEQMADLGNESAIAELDNMRGKHG